MKHQVKTQQLEHQRQLNQSPNKKDGASVISLKGGTFLRCWSMVYPSGVKCNPQSLLKKCARTWWSSWPFAQTGLLIVSYQPHQRTTNKIQNKTSGENATAGTPPEQAPEEAAGQQQNSPILERISLKGGTPLITWCVEKCLPFSRVKWNPSIFVEKMTRRWCSCWPFAQTGLLIVLCQAHQNAWMKTQGESAPAVAAPVNPVEEEEGRTILKSWRQI